jgi:oxygen-independent coproporphyrinogen-3 oxidase
LSERAAGLYLHVPFCRKICPYCDFAVRTGDRARRQRFVDHLLAEIELNADCPLCFDTVYLGGGTPSSLDADDLARILDAVRERLRLAARTWIFLEANPEDVTAESATAWRRLGIDTLSLGVQSLDADALVFLGRTHGVDDAGRAVSLALEAGFDTVSIDLIYGLPGQRPSAWRAQLDRALELGAHHASCYQLTIHERTRFGLLEQRGRLSPMSTDEQSEMFRLTHRHLNAAGLQGYEVSNFAATPRHHSRHNSKYWDHTPYLGLGPSAHSYHAGQRWWNVRRTDSWQERLSRGERPIEATETLGTNALVLEALMLGLRTYAGVDLERLRARWNVNLLGANPVLIERLEAEGLASVERDRLVPTLDGLAVADSLAPLFTIAAP